MATCIICGTDTSGHVCQSHEEDVLFEFTGTHENELTQNRFYKGTVDGFAEFGVFVNIGRSVTGLLHRSQLPKRLESLDWNRGDEVYVQVLRVHDNGNIDLGWSIRQNEREFRGSLIDTPQGNTLPDDEPESDLEPEPAVAHTPTGGEATAGESPEPVTGTPESATETPKHATESPESATETPKHATESPEPETQAVSTSTSGSVAQVERPKSVERVPVDQLSDAIGDTVRVEGEVVGIRQTSGPTVFTVRDETAEVECAAFESAGVRAYPDVDLGDVVALTGEVERRNGAIQVETEALDVLEDDDRDDVRARIDAALDDRVAPGDVDFLTDHAAVTAVGDDVRAAATEIRRAVLTGRPVVVRHTATADGYLAGAALERAVLPLLETEHDRSDAAYTYFDRRPLLDDEYSMADATADVTRMLNDRERHGEQLPLVLLVGAGSTLDSAPGIELLGLYDVTTVVVDADQADPDAERVADVIVASTARDVTTTVLAANVAVFVSPGTRDEIAHLPAVSYWENTPSSYVDLASDAGYDADACRTLREAVALEAHYHAYQDKRELVTDLLFDGALGLATHVSEQFRAKMDDELETAEANLDVRDVDGVSIALLDADAYTHRYDFPDVDLLVDALHRQQRDAGVDVTVAANDDELYIRSDVDVDVRALAETVAKTARDAGVEAAGGPSGRLVFLVGERDAVIDATLDAIADAVTA